MRVSINKQDVVCDAVEGEVILVNLKNGHYHSAAGIAAEIWAALERGQSSGEVVTALCPRFLCSARQVAEEVERFLGQLVDAGLVAENGSEPAPVLPPDGFEGPPFVAPVLTTYKDMESLLLLDPVHDVSGHGWPARKD
jgi:hypothetical protein